MKREPAIELLADHRRLEELFTQLTDAFGAHAREDTQQLWSRLEKGLEAHFAYEEHSLFPRFERVDATECAALRAEHAYLRARLAEFGAAVDLKALSQAAAQNFLDYLRAHAKRENGLLYRWANEALHDPEEDVHEGLLEERAARASLGS